MSGFAGPKVVGDAVAGNGVLSGEQVEGTFKVWQQERVNRVTGVIREALLADKCELRGIVRVLDDGRLTADIVIVAV